jgi:arginyl-tRNA synthetase
MTTLEKAKSQAAQALLAALPEGASATASDLVRPPQADMGDLSFPCFSAAKVSKGNPAAIAKDVAAKIAVANPVGLIGDVKAVGPYINFFFNKKAFATSVLEARQGRAHRIRLTEHP